MSITLTYRLELLFFRVQALPMASRNTSAQVTHSRILCVGDLWRLCSDELAEGVGETELGGGGGRSPSTLLSLCASYSDIRCVDPMRELRSRSRSGWLSDECWRVRLEQLTRCGCVGWAVAKLDRRHVLPRSSSRSSFSRLWARTHLLCPHWRHPP